MAKSGLVSLIIGIIAFLVGIGLLVWGLVRKNEDKSSTPNTTTLVLIISGVILIVIGILLIIVGIVYHHKHSKSYEHITSDLIGGAGT